MFVAPMNQSAITKKMTAHMIKIICLEFTKEKRGTFAQENNLKLKIETKN